MMDGVELIYDGDCPNVGQTREVLRQAFEKLGREPSWVEWERSSAATPARFRAYGSPTILVDGLDIAGAPKGEGRDCCRLYEGDGGRLTGVPPLERLVQALATTLLPAVDGSQSEAAAGGD